MVAQVNPEMLQQVVSDVASQQVNITEINAEISSVTEQLEEARASSDERQVQILEASLSNAIERAKKTNRDVNELALGLKVYFEQLGVSIKSLDELTPSEVALLEQAEADLEEAKDTLEDAKGAWFFKTSRVESAEAKIQEEEAKLANTHEEVKKLQRERILNADLEQTLQVIQSAASEAAEVLKTNRVVLEEEIKKLESEQEYNHTEMTRLTDASKTASEQQETLASKLSEAEMELEDLVPNSPEYQTQNEKVIALKREREDAEIEAKEFLAALQKQEKYCEDLQIYLSSQKKVLSSNRTMTEMLQQEVHQGSKLFNAWLEQKKQATALEAGDALNSLSTEVRLSGAQEMAEIGAAADRTITEALEQQTDVMNVLMTIKDAQAKSSAGMTARQKQIEAEMADKYGIDRAMGTFSSHNQ